MSNFISKSGKYLARNYKYIILITLILVLFILNLEKQINEYQMNKDVVGTYIMGEAVTGNAEYFVFDNNNYYCRYKQFNVIQEGEYEKIHGNVYILNNELKEYIVYSNDEIFYFNQDDVCFYSRIDDIPLFINVQQNK